MMIIGCDFHTRSADCLRDLRRATLVEFLPGAPRFPGFTLNCKLSTLNSILPSTGSCKSVFTML
jgi:hypothetical protein